MMVLSGYPMGAKIVGTSGATESLAGGDGLMSFTARQGLRSW
ncbi:MAG: hypothetical protein ACLS8Q_04385 [Anaerovoracaceae bacterium]